MTERPDLPHEVAIRADGSERDYCNACGEPWPCEASVNPTERPEEREAEARAAYAEWQRGERDSLAEVEERLANRYWWEPPGHVDLPPIQDVNAALTDLRTLINEVKERDAVIEITRGTAQNLEDAADLLQRKDERIAELAAETRFLVERQSETDGAATGAWDRRVKALGVEVRELRETLARTTKTLRDRLDAAEATAEQMEEALRETALAFRRCSPSAAWSAQGDLERGTPPSAEYPLQHLRRLAAELAVLFGEQREERLSSGEIPYGSLGVPHVPQGIARKALG